MTRVFVQTGVSYREECPEEPLITKYLLIDGALGFVLIAVIIWKQKKYRNAKYCSDENNDDDDPDTGMLSRSCRWICGLITAFLFVWHLLGSVWLFNIWKPSFRQPLHHPRKWCSEVVFYFVFYQLTFVYGLLAVTGLLVIVVTAIYFIKRRTAGI